MRRLAWLAALGALAAACAVPLDPPPAGPPDGAEPPRPGGVLREASPEDPRYLDPAKGYDTASWALEQMIFNTLVDYDAGTTIVPELAESWTLSPDGGGSSGTAQAAASTPTRTSHAGRLTSAAHRSGRSARSRSG